MPKIQYQEINFTQGFTCSDRRVQPHHSGSTRLRGTSLPSGSFITSLSSGYHPEQAKRIQTRGVHRQRRQISGPDRLGCARRPYQNIKSIAHWDSPESIIGAVADQYAIDKWEDQDVRPEVWIEIRCSCRRH